MRLTVFYATSIIAGFCMMALELMGGRVLQPAFGSSIDVWAAIISVFILSLSLGYVIGGRIADRTHTNLALGWIILIAGATYCLVPAIAMPFSNALGEGIQTARWGALLAGLVLFLPPSLLLGCVSPMLVRLIFTDTDRVGRTTGTLYAIGSLGNVLGVLVTDYELLKRFELDHSIYAMGIVLMVLGLAHIAGRIKAGAVRVVGPVGSPGLGL